MVFVSLVCIAYCSVNVYSRYVIDEMHVLNNEQVEYINDISDDLDRDYGINLSLAIMGDNTKYYHGSGPNNINLVVDITEKHFYIVSSNNFKLDSTYEAYQQAKLRYYINSNEAPKGIVNLYSNVAAEIYRKHNKINELNDKGFFNEIERDIGIIHVIVLLTIVILFILYKTKIFKF